MKRGDYRTPWPVKCAVSCVSERRRRLEESGLGERNRKGGAGGREAADSAEDGWKLRDIHFKTKKQIFFIWKHDTCSFLCRRLHTESLFVSCRAEQHQQAHQSSTFVSLFNTFRVFRLIRKLPACSSRSVSGITCVFSICSSLFSVYVFYRSVLL